MDYSRHSVYVLLLLLFSKPGTTLTLKNPTIPFYKIRGETAELNCNYELNMGERLYSVKWYKDDEEFYRFMPNTSKKQSVFPREGVSVEISESDGSKVSLKNLDFNSSGLYRCEISVDSSFESKNHSGRMIVVELPTAAPVISGVAEKYKSGDWLRANCTASRSHPAATITWAINDKEVAKNHVREYAPVLHKDGLETSIQELHLRLEDHHFLSGPLDLVCTATVAALYRETDRDLLQVEDTKLKPFVLQQRSSTISVNTSPPAPTNDKWLLLLSLFVSLTIRMMMVKMMVH